MAQSYFEIERGLELAGVNFIVGSVAPGSSGDSTTVGVGSYYLDDATGDLYTKVTAGSGTDKWKIQASKDYVDAVATGLDVKGSVRVASTAALGANTAAGSGIGKTLTEDGAGTVLTIDGVVVNLDDRVLVKDESASDIDNGIYTLTIVGVAATTQWVLTRATDADEDAEVTAGMFMFIEEGTINQDQGWVLTTNNVITVDTTALGFSQFSGGDDSAELGFIRDFVGKTGAGAETPTYSSNNYVTDTDTLEVAIGDLDAQVGTNATNIGTNDTDITNLQGEDGFIRTFVGKSAAGAENPTYTNDNQITTANDLEGAVDEIDTFLGADVTTGEYLTATENLNVSLEALQTGLTDARLTTTAAAVTTITTIDSANVDTYAAAKWIVHIQDNAVGTAKRVVEILAVHDGATADATDADYTVFAKLKMGTITGLVFTVDVSGAAGAQVMNLKITSTTSVDVKAIREVILF